MRNFRNSRNKLGYAYLLTPRGIESKAAITVDFLRRKVAEYEGVYDIEAGDDRVFVLLEFLGKLNKVKVCRDWLVPAA